MLSDIRAWFGKRRSNKRAATDEASHERYGEGEPARDAGDDSTWERLVAGIDASGQGSEAREQAVGSAALAVIAMHSKLPPTADGDVVDRELAGRMEWLAGLATPAAAALLFRAATWRYAMFQRRDDIEDVLEARRLLARASELPTRGRDESLAIYSLLVHVRNTADGYLPGTERQENADAAVGEARVMLDLASQLEVSTQERLGAFAPDSIPSARGGPHYDLAKVLRLRSLRHADPGDSRKALRVLEQAAERLEPTLGDEDQTIAWVRILNVRALCWKDLREEEPNALLHEKDALEESVRRLESIGKEPPSTLLRNLANTMGALLDRSEDFAMCAEMFRLYARAAAVPDETPEGLKMTSLNWAVAAARRGLLDEVIVACEAGLEGLRRHVAAQGGIFAARLAVSPINQVGEMLVAAHLARGELLLAAAAADRTRALVLDDSHLGDGSGPSASFTADLIRHAAERRCLCYVIDSRSPGGSYEVVAIVVAPGREPALVRGGGNEAKERLVEAMGTATALFESGEAYQEIETTEAALERVAAALWDLIVEAIVDRCRDVEELALIPTGNLAALPFGIAGPADGPGLVDQHAVSYPLSVRHLARSEARWRAPQARAVILTSPGDPTRRLHHVLEEASAVAELWRGRARETDSASSASSARAALPGADLVHVACHASHDLENPFDSSLLLDDGALTLVDVDFAASLVYLSACSTGRRGGYDVPSEAMSMASLVQRRGAAVVVSTEWPVMDLVAKAMAVLFYEALLSEAVTPAQALRLAQLRLRSGDVERGPTTTAYLSKDVDRLRDVGGLIVGWGAYAVSGAGEALNP